MEPGKLLVGFIFIVFGGLNIVKPEVYLSFQKKIFKKIYGAEFNPSDRTTTINKIFGAFFVLLGLLVLAAK